MKISRSPPSQFSLLLSLLCCFATLTTTVAAARQLGFYYTRNTGICTPQFWSSWREAWPRMVPQAATVSKVFGSGAFKRYRYDLTLAEAAGRNDENSNAFGRLVKESTAALLNSYARRDSFPFFPWEVKTLLIQSLVSEQAALVQAQRFSQANNNEDCN